ncbi:MAG: hypothetical protein FWE69_07650 [Clostridiales bacterium]|nr:hypothetical protein [Clostridiales bacterium]
MKMNEEQSYRERSKQLDAILAEQILAGESQLARTRAEGELIIRQAKAEAERITQKARELAHAAQKESPAANAPVPQEPDAESEYHARADKLAAELTRQASAREKTLTDAKARARTILAQAEEDARGILNAETTNYKLQ